jgi:hypothetical protein
MTIQQPGTAHAYYPIINELLRRLATHGPQQGITCRLRRPQVAQPFHGHGTQVCSYMTIQQSSTAHAYYPIINELLRRLATHGPQQGITCRLRGPKVAQPFHGHETQVCSYMTIRQPGTAHAYYPIINELLRRLATHGPRQGTSHAVYVDLKLPNTLKGMRHRYAATRLFSSQAQLRSSLNSGAHPYYPIHNELLNSMSP